jgi:hypothetical protein
VISTSTNGRALQSRTWRATTDAIFINELPELGSASLCGDR